MSGAFLMTVRCYLLFRRADTPYQAVFLHTADFTHDGQRALKQAVINLVAIAQTSSERTTEACHLL